MSTIKETTLHPDGNGGVDLYPKTNINQVQELPQKLTSVENQINQLNIDKLTKPTNPSAESAVTMLSDGTVGTKPLSEIGGGGKLFRHEISVTVQENTYLYFYFTDNVQNYSTFADIPIKKGVGYYEGSQDSPCPAAFNINVSDNTLCIYIITMNITNPSAGVQYNDVYKEFSLITYTDTSIQL